MSMLNTHALMPTSASVTGSAAATTTAGQLHGALSAALHGLGFALLILTAVFALAAIRGLLPRRSRTP
jgi:hypothetical protein